MTEQWQVFNGTSIEWNDFIFKNNSEYRQLYEWGETKKHRLESNKNMFKRQ